LAAAEVEASRRGTRRIDPYVAEWFEAGEIPNIRGLTRELGSLGLLGTHLQGYGCAGMSATDYGLACLELEASDSGIRSLVSVQGSLAMFAIWRWGSEEQKLEWLSRMATGEAIGCSVNPWVGREREQRRPTSADLKRSSVLVIGAGPAGLEAARALAQQGLDVELFERAKQIGGQFALASTLHEYPEYHNLLGWYAAELDHLGIRLHLGVEVTPELLAEHSADAIVVATGGSGYLPAVPGIDLPHVVDLRTFLAAGAPAPTTCTIFGADREGVAVADDLAAQGTRVLVVGTQQSLAPDVGRRAKMLVIPRLLEDPKVRVVLDVVLRRIAPERVLVSHNGSDEWVDAPGPLLVSQGVEPINDLVAASRALEPSLGVEVIGDAGGNGGSIQEGLRAAADAAQRVTLTSAASTVWTTN